MSIAYKVADGLHLWYIDSEQELARRNLPARPPIRSFLDQSRPETPVQAQEEEEKQEETESTDISPRTSHTRLKSPLPLPNLDTAIPAVVWPESYKYHISLPDFLFDTKRPSDHFSVEHLEFEPKRTEPKTVYELDWSPKRAEQSNPDGLEFESRFESGNLLSAIQTGLNEYQLQLNPDSSSKGHTQWYFFRIKNTQQQIYQFHITNLMKKDSLYGKGLQPCLFSEALAKTKKIGWHRAGADISYTRNNSEKKKRTYTLSFRIQFPAENDTVYLAHCIPYTYSMLQRKIASIVSNPDNMDRVRHRVLGKSHLGNNLDLISLTKKASDPKQLQERKLIVLTCRIHPGETNSSWMMHGFLDAVLNKSRESDFLLEHFIIKIVPMLNPDGVVIGNYRCNLKGYDLNRKWHIPKQDAHQVIELQHVLEMIQSSTESKDLSFFCDFHGHNRKQGVFVYGCQNTGQHLFKERLFPYLLSKQAPDLFFFKKCQFQIQESKEGTGRITIWRSHKIVNSFTIEASFCGSETGPGIGFQYSHHDLQRMGKKFATTLHQYSLSEWIEESKMDIHHQQLAKKTKKVKKEMFDLFKHNASEIMPDESATSDTTSDDEKLRTETLKVPKRKSIKKSSHKPVPKPTEKIQVEKRESVKERPKRPSSASSSRSSLTVKPVQIMVLPRRESISQPLHMKTVCFEPGEMEVPPTIQMYIRQMHHGMRPTCNHRPAAPFQNGQSQRSKCSECMVLEFAK
ncbi:hypothetical protein EDD86DRAFT_214173 [Gorgonomyces haynaldii]|nr:hypothetical protein EDD86DRAFT_214173 [Gorgonomyces haynaldii]